MTKESKLDKFLFFAGVFFVVIILIMFVNIQTKKEYAPTNIYYGEVTDILSISSGHRHYRTQCIVEIDNKTKEVFAGYICNEIYTGAKIYENEHHKKKVK
ncbi:MAG: hypothetical protein ACOC22_01765 [bacterium]